MTHVCVQAARNRAGFRPHSHHGGKCLCLLLNRVIAEGVSELTAPTGTKTAWLLDKHLDAKWCLSCAVLYFQRSIFRRIIYVLFSVMRSVVHVRRRIGWCASAYRMFRKVVHIACKRPDFVIINTGKDNNILTYLLH